MADGDSRPARSEASPTADREPRLALRSYEVKRFVASKTAAASICTGGRDISPESSTTGSGTLVLRRRGCDTGGIKPLDTPTGVTDPPPPLVTLAAPPPAPPTVAPLPSWAAVGVTERDIRRPLGEDGSMLAALDFVGVKGGRDGLTAPDFWRLREDGEVRVLG